MNKIVSVVQFIAGPGVARILSGSVIQRGCALIMSLALPYLLSEADFGAIRVITAYMMVILMAGSFCLDPATASYISRSTAAKDKARYGAHGLYLSCITSFSMGMIVVLLTWKSSFFDSKSIVLGLISRSGVLFLTVLTLLNIRILQAFGEIRSVAHLTGSIGIVKLMLTVPLTKFFGIWGWIIGMCASDLIVFLVTMRAVLPHISLCRPRWPETRNLLYFAGIQVISGIIAKTAGNLDIMVLEKTTASLAEVGHYALAAMFFKNATLVPTAFGVANFAKVGAVSCRPKELKPLLFKMFIRMFAIMFAIIVLMLTLVPMFIRAVYVASYEESIPILRLLCIGLLFLSAWVLISQVNIAIGKPLFEVFMSSIGLLFMVGSLYVFLCRLNMGLVGAALSLNICYFFGAVVGTLLLLRYFSKMQLCQTANPEVP